MESGEIVRWIVEETLELVTIGLVLWFGMHPPKRRKYVRRKKVAAEESAR